MNEDVNIVRQIGSFTIHVRDTALGSELLSGA